MKHLDIIEQSGRDLTRSEKAVLESGVQIIQQRSRRRRSVIDTFTITSLDVIVHYDDGKLGRGGFASVYEGDWKGEKVAVKVFDRDLPERVSLAACVAEHAVYSLSQVLQKEVDVWKHLRHPRIVQFYGACSIADPPFIVLAFMPNGDAAEYLYRNPHADRLSLVSMTIAVVETCCGLLIDTLHDMDEVI